MPGLLMALVVLAWAPLAGAAPVPGGTLNPLDIPKYVQPLVIPPQMPASSTQPGIPSAQYNIALRQFQQQILPGGQWNAVTGRGDSYPATTLWSYGREQDAIPAGFVAPVPLDPASTLGLPGQGNTFNYPAFTIENQWNSPTSVRWVNDLVNHTTGAFLPHLFAVDQTLMWANPPTANCIHGSPNQTDCETDLIAPYTGPVPMVVHVHGAHVDPHSDGYPEGWWLPGAPGTLGIPGTYSQHGSVYTQADYANTVPGSAFYNYRNDQAATTLWYHDHTLGMTRLNVYAGPAGFWLVRGGANGATFAQDQATGGAAVLPGPAPAVNPVQGQVNDPNFDATYRNTIREIPVAIQDRSFDWADADGNVLPSAVGATQAKLFYPSDRSFFDTFNGPFIGNIYDADITAPGSGTSYILGAGPTDANGLPLGYSDMSAIWNPEAFFNTMVVNGTTWPYFDVADAKYRLRLLNGCNSRTLNLALQIVASSNGALVGQEVPFYQIGGDQGFLPKVVKIVTGATYTLPGDGTVPTTPDDALAPADKALLMMSAERADVIVDFAGLPDGTRVRMINTAPDAPFGQWGDPPADAATSGQVMEFVVNTALHSNFDNTTTPVADLVLPAEAPLGTPDYVRKLSLNEMVSDQVCVNIDQTTGDITTLFSRPAGDPSFLADCLDPNITPPLVDGDTVDVAGPRQARLGVVISDGAGGLASVDKRWADPVTETPLLNSVETWEFYNTTVDAHPIHIHLVAYEVVDRQDIDPLTLLPIPGTVTPPESNEKGYKDTVVAYPGRVTRVKAKFDIAGLYVWHCHIVEHEDNEMMRPFTVLADSDGDGLPDVWETANNLDPNDATGINGANGDPDNEGLNNSGEYAAGTNPWNRDTDGDGYNDKLDPSPTQPNVLPPGWLLVPASDSDGNFILNWAPINNQPSVTYHILESKDGGAFTEVHTGTTTSALLNGRASGTYNYKIFASATGLLDSTQTSGNSTCTVSLTLPAPGWLLVPASDTDGNFYLNWAPVTSPSGATYHVLESKDGGAFTEVHSGTTTSTLLTGRTTGNYSYRVFTSMIGWTDSAQTDGKNSCGVTQTLNAPGWLLVPASDTDGNFYLNWAPVASPSGVTYHVLESKDGGAFTEVHSGTTTSTLLTGRTTGNYSYRVFTSMVGWTDSAQTDGKNSCGVTQTLNAPGWLLVPASDTDGNFYLNWAPVVSPSGVTYHVLESKDGGAFTEVHSGTTTSTLLTGRTTGSYSYQIFTTLAGWGNSTPTTGNNILVVP